MAGEPTFEELDALFGGGAGAGPSPSEESQAGPSQEEMQRLFEEEAMRQKAQENAGYLPQAGAFITGVGSTIPFAKDVAAGLKTGA